MPNWKRVKMFSDERFVEPVILLSRGIAFDPEPRLGVRSRLLMELMKTNTYFLRMFEDGKSTESFVGRNFFPAQESVFDLKVSVSKVANLVNHEVVKVVGLGQWQKLIFTLGYLRSNKQGSEVTDLAQTFCLESWQSVRIELICDGREEKLTLTKYQVTKR